MTVKLVYDTHVKSLEKVNDLIALQMMAEDIEQLHVGCQLDRRETASGFI
jgi:hypothetical protein